MFKRFFSCFNDSSDQRQIDLSRNTQPGMIAKYNPESNVMGQRINFETHDEQSNLQKHFVHNISGV